jgi:hypothetical protein
MTLVLNGTTGVSAVDGSAGTPAYQGSDANTGMFFPAADTIAFAEGGVEAMRIDSSGRLLVGLTSTNTAFGGKLQVEGTSDAFSSLVRYSSTAAGNPAFYFGRSKSATLGTNTIVASGDALGNIVFAGANGTGYSDAAYIQGFVDGTPGASADMPGRLVFSTSADGSATPTERMRIDSSGNLLVGKTVADDSTTGFAYRSSGYISAARNGGAPCYFNRTGTDGAVVEIANDGSTVGSISVSGSSTAYNTSSDYRLKQDIQPMQNALAKVAALKPVTYKWKVDGSDGEGFIAHELQAVVPDCVTGAKDAVDAEGKPVYQGIDTSFLVATLTAALQELRAIVDSQAARIAALEGAAS